jgi:hypothetical protein
MGIERSSKMSENFRLGLLSLQLLIHPAPFGAPDIFL